MVSVVDLRYVWEISISQLGWRTLHQFAISLEEPLW